MQRSLMTWLGLGLWLSACGGMAPEASPHLEQPAPTKNKAADRSEPLNTRPALEQANANIHKALRTAPTQPPAPPIPQRPAPLAIESFNPASHVGPPALSQWPKPVVVVLHGNYDRPEWECGLWQKVIGGYGWVLCPRGTVSAPPPEDRWTYPNRPYARREIDAALDALERRYPGRVSRKGMVLAGLSLGAIMAPSLVQETPHRYEWLALAEGGMRKMIKLKPKRLQRAGIKGVMLAMSMPWRRKVGKELARRWSGSGLPTHFVDMEGGGHGYSRTFARDGRASFVKMIEGEPREVETR